MKTRKTFRQITLLSLGLVFTISATIAFFSLNIKSVKAGCDFYDLEYGYHLVCIGEAGWCKFISPSGSTVTCTGNKAIAEPGVPEED